MRVFAWICLTCLATPGQAQYTYHWQGGELTQYQSGTETRLIWTEGDPVIQAVELYSRQQELLQVAEFQDKQLSFVFTPGEIYTAKMRDINGVAVDSVVFATPSLSSGEIRVYFNNSILPSVGLPNNLPWGTTASQCSDATLSMINNAKYTIDVAMYNTNYTAFVNALKAARARGVRVRMIADHEQNNSGLNTSLGFPVLYGSANQQGIMHNKFIIVDADAPNPNDSWVSSGSTNWTTGQVLFDPNNLILIQDQALARAYKIEFEEMWGSNGANYNLNNARFGANKTDNTPHYFDLKGTQVELWFSPSDQLNSRIKSVINSANSTLDFGLLLLTKDDFASTLINKFQQGVKVRGILDDDDNLASPYYTLRNAGVPVHLHTDSDIFHHKYAIVDVNNPGSDPLVLTGSHNWTYSAETFNDENTLVIHSQKIADLYFKEFEKRWSEVNPLSSDPQPGAPAIHIEPNPVLDFLRVRDGGLHTQRLEVISVLGEPLIVQNLSAQHELAVDCGQLPPGMYFLVLITTNGRRISIPFCRA